MTLGDLYGTKLRARPPQSGILGSLRPWRLVHKRRHEVVWESFGGQISEIRACIGGHFWVHDSEARFPVLAKSPLIQGSPDRDLQNPENGGF